MAVEAMFTVEKVTAHAPQGTQTDLKDREVPMQDHDVVLKAYVGGDHPYEENADWSVWTPEGEIKMQIRNADAAKYFEPGQDYRVVFTKRQPQQARTPDPADYVDEESFIGQSPA